MLNMQAYSRPVSCVTGIGAELPDREIDNQALVRLLQVPPNVEKRLVKLIDRVTGVKTRRYAESTTCPSDLACAAADKALQHAGIAGSDVDTLIFAATDMDMLEPSTANIIQSKLGLRSVNSFDVTNACNSFLQAMNVANSMLAAGSARKVLITSGEIGSQWVERQVDSVQELNTKMGGLTLGDAGAAVIMERANDSAGLLEINLMSLGHYWEACHVPERTNWRDFEPRTINGWFFLDMSQLATIAREATVEYFKDYIVYRRQLAGEESFLDSLAQIIPHQISRRFIEDISTAVAAHVRSIDARKICITADIYGNTASTSIPLAITKLLADGVLEFGTGQEIMAYGAASGFGIGHIRLRL
jgi:3-oxoacyl-[acyl-carrier-protein] synthase-3